MTPDLAKQALEALENSRQFIVNGVEFGYIRMPDRDTPDSAHETLPEIEAAIAALRSFRESGGDAAHINLSTYAWGVSRMGDNPKAVLVSFRSEPTDEDLRALHEALRPANGRIVHAH